MKKIVTLLQVVLLMSCSGCAQKKESANDGPPGDYVVLLHGLFRSSWSMKPLEKRLKREGYRVVNIDYPTTKDPIETHAERLGQELAKHCTDGSAKIHFVTHSMGGIVLRYYLERNAVPQLGRVVMLAPPSQGSEIVDNLAEHAIFRKIIGPSGEKLGTDPASVPSRLGPVTFELGIIAGNRKLIPILSGMVPGESDGTVSVEHARAEGMTDFIIVPHSHSFIMMHAEVADQVVHFLRYGEFQKDEDDTTNEKP